MMQPLTIDPYANRDRRSLNVVRARAPRKLLDDLKAASQREGVAASEFIRRALRDRIHRALDAGATAA